MKDTGKYSEKYKHNEALVEYLNATKDFPDWMVIATFYSALHYMNLFLCTQYNIDSDHINSHSSRNSIIKNKCSRKISDKYNILYDLSRTARYQYIDMSRQLSYAQSCYKNLKEYCVEEIKSKSV